MKTSTPTRVSASWLIGSGRVESALEELRKLTRRGVVTLVTATRDLDGSQAAVLAKLLEGS
jgi:uncharacterized protein YeaO (DUF488 family)